MFHEKGIAGIAVVLGMFSSNCVHHRQWSFIELLAANRLFFQPSILAAGGGIEATFWLSLRGRGSELEELR